MNNSKNSPPAGRQEGFYSKKKDGLVAVRGCYALPLHLVLSLVVFGVQSCVVLC